MLAALASAASWCCVMCLNQRVCDNCQALTPSPAPAALPQGERGDGLEPLKFCLFAGARLAIMLGKEGFASERQVCAEPALRVPSCWPWSPSLWPAACG